VPKRLDRQVNIKVGPIEVMRAWQLDVAQLADRYLFEPREVFEGQEVLTLCKPEPKPMLGNVCNLNH